MLYEFGYTFIKIKYYKKLINFELNLWVMDVALKFQILKKFQKSKN